MLNEYGTIVPDRVTTNEIPPGRVRQYYENPTKNQNARFTDFHWREPKIERTDSGLLWKCPVAGCDGEMIYIGSFMTINPMHCHQCTFCGVRITIDHYRCGTTEQKNKAQEEEPRWGD